MKKLILLVVIAAAVYLLWGNINKEGVKDKYNKAVETAQEEAKEIKDKLK